MSLPHRTRARHRLWPIMLASALLAFAPGRGAAAAQPAKPLAAPAASEATPAVAAAEPSPLRQQLEALKAAQTELNAQRQKWNATPPEQRTAQLDPLLRSGSQYRRLLHDAALALSAEAPAAGSAEDRNALLALVREQLPLEAQKLSQELAEHSRTALSTLDELPRAKPDQLADLQRRRDGTIGPIPILLQELQDNIDARKALKQDINAEQTQLRELLLDTSKWMSSALRTTAIDIDRIKLDAYGKPKADEQGHYDALIEFRSLLADAQRKNIALMDQYGIDTVQLRQELISITGQMSQDILDAQVMKGLVTGWKADVSRWFSEHAAAIAFRIGSLALVLLLFAILARMGRSLVRRALIRAKGNPASLASSFLVMATGRIIWLVGLVIAAAQLGIEVGPLLAGLGIAGFVAGFALQDTLSNFAAGLMILVYRPFDVGDLIEAGGVAGVVRAMTLVSTSVLTLDNQLLIVPNGKIWAGVIRNVTNQELRRVDMTFSVSYRDDISQAESVLVGVIADNPRVLEDPAPVVRLHELGEASIKFVVRPWVKSADYWDAYWEITREVKRRFDAQGFSVPFPQHDVHVYEERRFERAPRESEPAPAFAVGS